MQTERSRSWEEDPGGLKECSLIWEFEITELQGEQGYDSQGNLEGRRRKEKEPRGIT